MIGWEIVLPTLDAKRLGTRKEHFLALDFWISPTCRLFVTKKSEKANF